MPEKMVKEGEHAILNVRITRHTFVRVMLKIVQGRENHSLRVSQRAMKMYNSVRLIEGCRQQLLNFVNDPDLLDARTVLRCWVWCRTRDVQWNSFIEPFIVISCNKRLTQPEQAVVQSYAFL